MARWRSSLLLTAATVFCTIAAVQQLGQCFVQLSAREFREAEGSALNNPVAAFDVVLMEGLTRQEKQLMTQLKDASKSQNWQKVKSLWSRYSGSAFPVACAAMQAAVNCGQYKEAAKVHRKLWARSPRPNSSIPYTLGIKIFSKLGQNDAVQSIWAEAQHRDLVDDFVAGSQIDAAAVFGNVTGAAEALDYMIRHNFPVGADRFNSAINACKNSNESLRHNASMYLFQEMISRGLQPNQVTFGSLLGAHIGAPLPRVLKVLQLQKQHGIT